MFHVGIDISKTKFDACLLGNNKPRLKVFGNSIEGFHAFMKWLEEEGVVSAHVCMEGTGRLWEPLAEFLYAKKCQVSVVNPARIRGFAQSEMRRSKTDKIDAKIIARFCRAQVPSAWVAPPAEVKALRDRQRYVDTLKESRAQENNRLKSGVLDVRVQRTIERHIEYLDQEIETMEVEILELVESHAKLRRDFNLLTSIIAVGQTTAVTFLDELSCAKNFSSSRELEVFCGIAPRLFESGSSVRSRSKMLYMPALCALRTNPTIIDFAARLRAAGKPGKVVVGAVMRKLLRIMFAVLKSGKPFEIGFKSQQPLSTLPSVPIPG